MFTQYSTVDNSTKVLAKHLEAPIYTGIDEGFRVFNTTDFTPTQELNYLKYLFNNLRDVIFQCMESDMFNRFEDFVHEYYIKVHTKRILENDLFFEVVKKAFVLDKPYYIAHILTEYSKEKVSLFIRSAQYVDKIVGRDVYIYLYLAHKSTNVPHDGYIARQISYAGTHYNVYLNEWLVRNGICYTMETYKK